MSGDKSEPEGLSLTPDAIFRDMLPTIGGVGGERPRPRQLGQ